MSEPTPILYPRAAMDQWHGSGATKSSYTLDEYLELIEPTYQVYEEYIRKCVAGLTTAAAQQAALHQEEDIPKLREMTLNMIPFLGLEGGIDTDLDTSQRIERQYKESFDHAVSAARQSGQAPSLPESAKKEILIGLEIHRQELENNGEMDNWVEECMSLQEQLRSEWQIEADPSQKAVPQIEIDNSQQAAPAMEGMSL